MNFINILVIIINRAATSVCIVFEIDAYTSSLLSIPILLLALPL